MRYINLRLTYLLTYLLTYFCNVRGFCQNDDDESQRVGLGLQMERNRIQRRIGYVRRSGERHGHGGRRRRLELFLLASLSIHRFSSVLRYVLTATLSSACCTSLVGVGTSSRSSNQ